MLLFLSVAQVEGQGLGRTEAAHKAYILVIDHSGSMDNNDPLKLRLAAATLFVDAAGSQDQVGVVVFGVDTQELVPLQTCADATKANVCDKIQSSPRVERNGTDIIAALGRAALQVEQALLGGLQPEVVLMTDGKMEGVEAKYARPGRRNATKEEIAADEKAALEAILIRSFKHVPVHCIALGKEADTEFLKTVCTTTSGGYFTANSSGELLAVYLNILMAGKGMMSIESADFQVWPAAREINLVLFRANATTRIKSVEVDGDPRVPGDQSAYWSVNRRNPAQYYEFMRDVSPKPGTWHVNVTNAGGNLRIHALQSAPFDFTIVAPSGGKVLVGAPVRFVAELTPLGADGSGLVRQLLQATRVTVEITAPDKTKQKFDLPPAGQQFVGTTTFPAAGDYVADFKAEFQQAGQVAWTTMRRKIFRAGPPDFELVIKEPAKGRGVAEPFGQLNFRAELHKVDPDCPVDSLPADTELTLDILSEKLGSMKQSRWLFGAGGLEGTLLGGNNPVLDPGNYRIRIEGRHPSLNIKPGEADLSIGPWPQPRLDSLKGMLYVAATAAVGEDLPFQATLIKGVEKTCSVGELVDAHWRLAAVSFEFQRSDKVGSLIITNLNVSLNSQPAACQCTNLIRASGSNQFRCKARLKLDLEIGGQRRAQTNLVVEFASVDVNVPLIQSFSVAPPVLGFSEAATLGHSATSAWFTVSNDGETDLELVVSLAEFKHGDVSLSRFYTSLMQEGIALKSPEQRPQEFPVRLKAGQQLRWAVLVELPGNAGDFDLSETIPSGTYAGRISVQTPVSSSSPIPGLRPKELKVTLERK